MSPAHTHIVCWVSTLQAMAETGEEVKQAESQGAGALSTVHLYYTDTELFSNTARIIAIREAEVNGEKLVAIITDETVMHPQGGEEQSWLVWVAVRVYQYGI